MKSILRRTWSYLRRNGLRQTVIEALDHLTMKKPPYEYVPPTPLELSEQSHAEPPWRPLISVIVPVYEADPKLFRACIDSVMCQSHAKYELIIADADHSEDNRELAESYRDERIHYLPLERNLGIAANTNIALMEATGDYVAFLDADDLLTADALYEMATAIVDAWERGPVPKLLYSDEDKCDEEGERFFEPHLKTDFNLDLLLTHNYFCHLVLIDRPLAQKLCLRPPYDGAQDYDLVLRAVLDILGPNLSTEGERFIVHVPRVLYHWRSHAGSASSNPTAKSYAYEAGKRAVQSFLDEAGIAATVTDTPNLGHYKVTYDSEDIFAARPDIGAVGYPVYENGRIIGGITDRDGACPYAGLRKGFGGYMHRGALMQDAWAVDLEHALVRESLAGLDCDGIRELGYRILWQP